MQPQRKRVETEADEVAELKAKLQGFCALLANFVKQTELEIEREETRVDTMRERLRLLSSKPHPDLAQIQQLTRDIEELEAHLVTSGSQLQAMSDEFTERCGP